MSGFYEPPPAFGSPFRSRLLNPKWELIAAHLGRPVGFGNAGRSRDLLRADGMGRRRAGAAARARTLGNFDLR